MLGHVGQACSPFGRVLSFGTDQISNHFLLDLSFCSQSRLQFTSPLDISQRLLIFSLSSVFVGHFANRNIGFGFSGMQLRAQELRIMWMNCNAGERAYS
jgi:hypothetical protein